MKGRVIGMVQTRPLPGSYRNRGERISFITEQALEETRILAECGVQSVILQNMGDMPIRQQSAPEAIAYLSVVAQAIRRSFPALCLGVLVNWDGVAALAVADAAGAALKEEVELPVPLQKEDQDGAAAALVHPLRLIAAVAGGDGVDLPHRRKVRARGQLRMVTSSALGAYSPSRDQGSSPAGSAVRVEMWRKIRSSWW